ncbi:hypothetical protein IRJ41_023240 [Triplophysa rosa]|uniref:Uncharacterized protein n=1 Tax=Triplophysa rosa TaxID=992332 RepID=A0A9W8CAK5_TRIRA|nr:hypothetical protein IRJ41_023240 [Triplophysa rosa]
MDGGSEGGFCVRHGNRLSPETLSAVYRRSGTEDVDPVTEKNTRNPLQKRRVSLYGGIPQFACLVHFCPVSHFGVVFLWIVIVKTCSLVASIEARTECSPIAEVSRGNARFCSLNN